MVKNIVVIGSSGAIGRAFVEQLSSLYKDAIIYAFARSQNKVVKGNVSYHPIDYGNEKSIEKSVLMLPSNEYVDLVIVATGILHNQDIMPEKSLQDISFDKFICLFESNTILPALVAKYFLRRMSRDKKAIFAVEMKRSHKKSIVIGLHPGTVDSKLSKPFQANVKEDELFTAEFSVKKLIEVINNVTPSDSGRCFAWDGKEVLP